MSFKRAYMALCTVLLPFLVKAQYSKDTLGNIEIAASRNAQKDFMKTVSFDSSLMQTHFAGSLTDLLSQSSVYIKNYGPSMVASPGFRGTAEDHTKTYWNGIPLNSSMYGIQDLNLVPVFLLDGVDVRYGGASLANGSGGFGGSLDLVSGTRQSPVLGEIASTAGNFGTYKEYAAANYGGQKWWASTKAYYTTAKNDFPYINTFKWNTPKETEQDASMYQYGALQTIGFQATDKDLLKGDIWYQNSFRNLPQTMISNTNHEYQADEAFRANILYRHAEEHFLWETNASYVNEYLFYHNEISDINSHSWNSRYELKSEVHPYFTFPLRLQAGLQDVEETANIHEYNGLKTRNRPGIWATLSYPLSETWETAFDGRAESMDFKSPEPAFTAAIAWKPFKNEKLVWHVNGGRNFNFPNLNDLYWYPGGNPGLQPEHDWFGEMGLSSDIKTTSKSNLHTELTVFSNWIDDYIQWTPTGSSYWQAQNLKKVWARGAEGSLTYTQNLKNGWWQLRASGQYTPSTDENTKSGNGFDLEGQLINLPLFTAQGSAQVHYKKYSLTAEYAFTGARNTTDVQLPGFGLVNLYAGADFNLGQKTLLQVQLKCTNLFDTPYQVIVWRPMPGRYLEASVILKRMKN